jgi:hypothetical protein
MKEQTKDAIISELMQTIKACKCDIAELKALLEKISDVGFEFLTMKLHTGGHADHKGDIDPDEGFTGHS